MRVGVYREHRVVGDDLAGERIGPCAPKTSYAPRLSVCSAEAPPHVFSGFPVGLVERRSRNNASLSTLPRLAERRPARNRLAASIHSADALWFLPFFFGLAQGNSRRAVGRDHSPLTDHQIGGAVAGTADEGPGPQRMKITCPITLVARSDMPEGLDFADLGTDVASTHAVILQRRGSLALLWRPLTGLSSSGFSSKATTAYSRPPNAQASSRSSQRLEVPGRGCSPIAGGQRITKRRGTFNVADAAHNAGHAHHRIQPAMVQYPLKLPEQCRLEPEPIAMRQLVIFIASAHSKTPWWSPA